jgi:hypothetical protein
MSKKTNKQVRLVVLDVRTVTEDNPEGERYLAIMPAHKVSRYKAGLAHHFLVTKEYWR